MDIIKPISIKKINGIYETEALNFVKSLAENNEYKFDVFNIALDQHDKETKINIVSPTKFYENFVKLKKEPSVPLGSNENQILSFYGSLFKKYDGLKFNEKTFLYEKNFPNFETEVVLLSSLLKSSNGYEDFDKPYIAIEFYINNQKIPQLPTLKNYFFNVFKNNNNDLKKYLKRFATNKQILPYKNYSYVKNFTNNTKSIYKSFDEPIAKNVPSDNSGIYEKGFPEGMPLPLEETLATKIPILKSFSSISELLKSKGVCNYDVVGYVITKSIGNNIIKRFYIMNDESDMNFKGYIRYFDSQIIEGKQYSYKIEQINNIYGVVFTTDPQKSSIIGTNKKQKDSFIQKEKEPQIKDVFDVLNEFGYIDKSEENVLPFYNDKPLSLDTFFNTELKLMTAYSPIADDSQIETPDIVVETEILTTPPSTPDIKIYGRKGDSKNVLILLSNLISIVAEVTGITNKVNVIDLGISVKQQQFKTKEFRVFRTEDKPISYDSFSKTPRKILNPNFPDFVDSVEPNTIYYYYADAVDSKDAPSKPSKVLKLQVVEEQSHVFPLLEVYEFGEEKQTITEKMFRKNIKIVPTFLQSAVGPKAIVGEYITPFTKNGYNNKLFLTKAVNAQQSDPIPTHKIRVTSKKTRRRFDINTIFSFENVKSFNQVPEGAVLVLEEPLKNVGEPCSMTIDCAEKLFCKFEKFVGKCASVQEAAGVTEELFGKSKCDIGETLDKFLAGLSGVPGGFLIAAIVGGLFIKAAEKVNTEEQCNNIVPLIIKTLEEDIEFKDVAKESKDAIKESLQKKVIKGKFTS